MDWLRRAALAKYKPSTCCFVKEIINASTVIQLSGNKISHETVFHTPPRNTTNPQARSGMSEKSAHHFSTLENAPFRLVCSGICGAVGGAPGGPRNRKEGLFNCVLEPKGRRHLALCETIPALCAYHRQDHKNERRRCDMNSEGFKTPEFQEKLRNASTPRSCLILPRRRDASFLTSSSRP